MAYGTQVTFEPVREVAFDAISGTYAAVGAPTTDHTRIATFSNGTNGDLYVSFDGIVNHLRIAANGFKLFDFCSDKVSADGFFLREGTQIWVKQVSAPTSGTFWVEICYASGGV